MLPPSNSPALPPADFSGQAPLFPLPNVTLFPRVMLPLHIFEPRYRQMVADVLESDRLLAMALLKDGWEDRYESKECPLHETVCLGRIVADEQLDDGRYMLLLEGVCRAQLIGEESTPLPYRIGRLKLIDDLYPDAPVIDRDHRQTELVQFFRKIFPKLNIDEGMIHALADCPLGELCDMIAHALRLEPAAAQRLLDQVDVDLRSDQVLELLKLQCRDSVARSGRPFPPDFSLN